MKHIAVKAQQILLTKSCLQVIVILNVSEFHLVVNSSTRGINLKQITQQLNDVSVLLKSSNLCWKSSISATTNSDYFSCCTVSVGLVVFEGRMERLAGRILARGPYVGHPWFTANRR